MLSLPFYPTIAAYHGWILAEQFILALDLFSKPDTAAAVVTAQQVHALHALKDGIVEHPTRYLGKTSPCTISVLPGTNALLVLALEVPPSGRGSQLWPAVKIMHGVVVGNVGIGKVGGVVAISDSLGKAILGDRLAKYVGSVEIFAIKEVSLHLIIQTQKTTV